MSARGRGNGTAKRGIPNLNLAGKRESTGESKQPKKDVKPNTRGRGGRGDHRGGRGGRGGKFQKPTLIQSEGIFSEGLYGEAINRRSKDSEVVSFAKNSRNGIQKKDPKEEEMEIEQSKASFEGWEAEWHSDTEEDNAALEELTGHVDFIADYKQGDRLPVVLPSKDEPQFHKLMQKQVKRELKGRLEQNDFKLEDVPDPTKFLSRKAGELLTKAFEDGSEETLIFLQLPSAVNVLAASSNYSVKQPVPNDDQSPADNNTQQSCFPELPQGKKVGKIQITESGRAILRMGDTVMDITTAAPTELRENAILLETKPEFSQNPQVGSQDTGINAIYHMGEIKHHFVASVNWPNFRPVPNQVNKDEPTSPSKPNVAILKELRDLDEITASWAEEAHRLAMPHSSF